VDHGSNTKSLARSSKSRARVLATNSRATHAGLSVVASFIILAKPFDMADKYYVKPQQRD